MKKVSNNEVSELDEQLYRTLKYYQIDKDTITGVFLMATGQRERKKLLSYAEFRGNRNNESDLLSYVFFLNQQKGQREQVMPFGLFARYDKETNSELTKDKIYKIDVLYGVREDVYLLVNDNNSKRNILQVPLFYKNIKQLSMMDLKRKDFIKDNNTKLRNFIIVLEFILKMTWFVRFMKLNQLNLKMIIAKKNWKKSDMKNS